MANAGTTDTRNVIPDLEPDEEWKKNQRDEIEQGLSSMVADAKRIRDSQLNEAPVDEALMEQHHQAMNNIRSIAAAQFEEALERERYLRRWSRGLEGQDEFNKVKETAAIKSAAIRSQWRLFEKWLATVKSATAQESFHALEDTTNRSMQDPSKSHTRNYDAKKRDLDQIMVRMARLEWHKRLAVAGLVAEDWLDMMPAETVAVVNALGREDDQSSPPSPSLPTGANASHAGPTSLPIDRGQQPSTSLSHPAHIHHPTAFEFVSPSTFRDQQTRNDGFSNESLPHADNSLEGHSDRRPGHDSARDLSQGRSPSRSHAERAAGWGEAHFAEDIHDDFSANIGPVLHDPQDTKTEEEEFERFKMEIREKKIWEFHYEAAAASTQLARHLGRRNMDKQRVRALLAEHERSMERLKRVKEDERRLIVDSEREKRPTFRRRDALHGAAANPWKEFKAVIGIGLDHDSDRVPGSRGGEQFVRDSPSNAVKPADWAHSPYQSTETIVIPRDDAPVAGTSQQAIGLSWASVSHANSSHQIEHDHSPERNATSTPPKLPVPTPVPPEEFRITGMPDGKPAGLVQQSQASSSSIQETGSAWTLKATQTLMDSEPAADSGSSVWQVGRSTEMNQDRHARSTHYVISTSLNPSQNVSAWGEARVESPSQNIIAAASKVAPDVLGRPRQASEPPPPSLGLVKVFAMQKQISEGDAPNQPISPISILKETDAPSTNLKSLMENTDVKKGDIITRNQSRLKDRPKKDDHFPKPQERVIIEDVPGEDAELSFEVGSKPAKQRGLDRPLDPGVIIEPKPNVSFKSFTPIFQLVGEVQPEIQSHPTPAPTSSAPPENTIPNIWYPAQDRSADQDDEFSCDVPDLHEEMPTREKRVQWTPSVLADSPDLLVTDPFFAAFGWNPFMDLGGTNSYTPSSTQRSTSHGGLPDLMSKSMSSEHQEGRWKAIA